MAQIYDKTMGLFANSALVAPKDICEQLLLGGDDWAEDRPQDDDITLVVLKARWECDF